MGRWDASGEEADVMLTLTDRPVSQSGHWTERGISLLAKDASAQPVGGSNFTL